MTEKEEKTKFIIWYDSATTCFGELIETLIDGTYLIKNPAAMYFIREEGKLFIDFVPFVQNPFFKKNDNIWKIKPSGVLEDFEMHPEALMQYAAAISVKAKKTDNSKKEA